MANTTLVSDMRACIKAYPDFPKKGVVFQDIHPLMANPSLCERYLSHLYKLYEDKGVTRAPSLHP